VRACRASRTLSNRLAVDDLGAGYSGLSSLPLLAPEFVKIDMSLVRAIDSDAPKRRIVTGLVALAHELGMKVVSEGVETERERDTLVDAGTDFLQGYLLGKPARRDAVPAPDLRA
jgi:EAL domain-containing protein (putative c-di-GMP-specific phosphodiesterase class I)